MQVTVQQIVNGAPALRSLANEKLPARVAFRLSGVLKQVQEHLSAYDEARIQTLENAGCTKREDGTGYEIPEDRHGDIESEINSLLTEEVEIAANPIPLSALDGASLTAQQLMALDWLITDDAADE